MKTVKTFASRAKAIEKKYPNKDISKVEKESFMDEIKALADEQEAFKASNNIQSPGQQNSFPMGGQTYMALHHNRLPYGGKAYMDLELPYGGKTYPYGGKAYMSTDYPDGGPTDPPTKEADSLHKAKLAEYLNLIQKSDSISNVGISLMNEAMDIGDYGKMDKANAVLNKALGYDTQSMTPYKTLDSLRNMYDFPGIKPLDDYRKVEYKNGGKMYADGGSTPYREQQFLNALYGDERTRAEGVTESGAGNASNSIMPAESQGSNQSFMDRLGSSLKGVLSGDVAQSIGTLAPALTAMSTNLAQANNIYDPTLIRPERVTPYINPNYFDINPAIQQANNQMATMNYNLTNQGTDFANKANALNKINQGTLSATGNMMLEGQRVNMAEDARMAQAINRADEINTANLNQAYLYQDAAQGQADQMRRTYRGAAMASLMGGMEDLQYQNLAKQGAPYLEALAKLKAINNGR